MEAENDICIFTQDLKKRKGHYRYFKIFNVNAFMAWDDGNDEIDIICHNQFTKGNAEGKYYPFSYDMKRKVWYPFAPRGAAMQIREAIYEIVVSCNPNYGSTDDPI